MAAGSVYMPQLCYPMWGSNKLTTPFFARHCTMGKSAKDTTVDCAERPSYSAENFRSPVLCRNEGRWERQANVHKVQSKLLVGILSLCDRSCALSLGGTGEPTRSPSRDSGRCFARWQRGGPALEPGNGAVSQPGTITPPAERGYGRWNWCPLPSRICESFGL